ncbi:hypothetical protein FRC12_012523, partial [Ceratobasidium sp. 428]
MANAPTSNAWVVVNNERTRANSQSTSNNLLKTYVSLEELCAQQRLFDGFRRGKQKPQGIRDEGSSALQRPVVAQPPLKRPPLKSLPSGVVSGHSRNVTVSSTGATVGDTEDEPLPPYKRPQAPSMPSSNRQKLIKPEGARLASSRRPAMRTQTGPAHLQAGPTLLN